MSEESGALENNSNPLQGISSNALQYDGPVVNPEQTDSVYGDVPPPNSVPDRLKNTGIGVLIDTDSLMAPKGSSESRNPYYIVFKGRRYYGSSPRAVVKTFRDQYNTNLRSGKLGAVNSKPGVVRSFFSRAKNLSRKAGTAIASSTAAAAAAARRAGSVALNKTRRVGTAAASAARRVGSAAVNTTRRVGSATASAARRVGSAAARGTTAAYASTQTRYASWKQGRVNATAAKAAAASAARGGCGFVKGDRVIVAAPSEEHISENGKVGIVQNVQPPAAEDCSIIVKMGRGTLITFVKEELKLASTRDRLGNVSRRFKKSITQRSSNIKQKVKSGYGSVKTTVQDKYGRFRNRKQIAAAQQQGYTELPSGE